MTDQIKTVLTITGTQSDPREISNAIMTSKGLEAHLAVLVLDLAMPSPVSQYGMATAIHRGVEYEHGLKAVEDRANTVRAELEQSAPGSDVYQAYVLPGEVDNVVAEYASCTDLTIFPAGVAGKSSLHRHALHGALFKAGGTVLLLPLHGSAFPKIDQAMIAWDAGPQAARAVRSTIGLLGTARQVQSVMVDPDKDDDGVDRQLIRYLDRHGISVGAQHFTSEGKSVAQTLLTAAHQMQADLIVMGAYGHSRLRERVFGGTTRDIIEQADMPVLLSH